MLQRLIARPVRRASHHAAGSAPAAAGAGNADHTIRTDRPSIVRTILWEGSLQHYWDFHPAPDPGTARTPDAAPVIFMVHGFRGDHHGLLRIVQALPAHRIIVPDLPGFGQSGQLDGPHTTEAYSRFVEHSLKVLGLGPATVLLGHSFGSIIAADFAARRAGSIAALVLVNPICAPALEGPSRLASKAAELYYVAAARLPETAGRALLANPLIVRLMSIYLAKTQIPGLRRYIHGQHAAYFSAFASRRVVLEAFRASISGTVRDVAADLRMPVLLIAAELDDIGSLEGQRRLADVIPSATLSIIPGVGHLIHYEKPVEAAHLITSFLATGPARELIAERTAAPAVETSPSPSAASSPSLPAAPSSAAPIPAASSLKAAQ
ncbi:alpha/beta hydrolase [Arthrobacter sp. Br18]|uniref:alpha/beta fold hydrolase n=1 Tax=Arthrobacter sp. Br18 TaxID=1312954 RepID=UPI0004B0DE0E|nr:alpha/beta hydrolase [Arthrobacter sp. Br18]